MVDAADLKSVVRKDVPVRVRSGVLTSHYSPFFLGSLLASLFQKESALSYFKKNKKSAGQSEKNEVKIPRLTALTTIWQGSSVVEQRTHKPLVGCSNHLPATKFSYNRSYRMSGFLLGLMSLIEVDMTSGVA